MIHFIVLRIVRMVLYDALDFEETISPRDEDCSTVLLIVEFCVLVASHSEWNSLAVGAPCQKGSLVGAG